MVFSFSRYKVPSQQKTELGSSFSNRQLPSNVHVAEENKINKQNFTNPFFTPVQDNASLPLAILYIQICIPHQLPQDSEYRWTKISPLTRSSSAIHPEPSCITIGQLAHDREIVCSARHVSIVEPKNIKEAMADFAWIEAMQEELHQFDRLQVWELVDKPFGKTVIKLKWLWKTKRMKTNCKFPNKANHFRKGYLRKRGNTVLGDKLVSWMSKKQDCTAMSSAEAEYVALSASCAQVMWMRTRSTRWQRQSRRKDKDLKISDEKTKLKDNDKGSRSKITKHEGTCLQRRPRQRQKLNDKSNLIDLTKECHNELSSGEIVSLKILSRTMEVRSLIILGLDIDYFKDFKNQFPAIVYNDALTSEPEVSSDFKNEFPAIVYNDALTSEAEVSSEPTVSAYPAIKIDFDFKISSSNSNDEDYTFIYDKNSFSYKLVSIDDLKSDKDNDNDEIDFK
ncbi:hypothetical protein Tco_0367768 [Tanacetum coccineum]